MMVLAYGLEERRSVSSLDVFRNPANREGSAGLGTLPKQLCSLEPFIVPCPRQAKRAFPPSHDSQITPAQRLRIAEGQGQKNGLRVPSKIFLADKEMHAQLRRPIFFRF